MFSPDMHTRSTGSRHVDHRLRLTPAQAQRVNDGMHGLHNEGFAYMPVDGSSMQGMPGPRVGGIGESREPEAIQTTRVSTRPRRAAAQSRRRPYDTDDDFTFE
jgi:hypothetical protein